MKRQLSSIITPFYKVIPFVVALYGLFLFIYKFHSASFGGMIFLFLWCAIWYSFTFRWKSVYLKDNVLFVSNTLKRIEIPLSAVENVEASKWWGVQPRIITLRLKSPSEFGEEIVFVPRLGGLEAGKVAEELRRLIAAHK